MQVKYYERYGKKKKKASNVIYNGKLILIAGVSKKS